MAMVLAVLRTAFLLFIVVYAVVGSSAVWGSATAAVTVEAWHRLHTVTWIAIAWIAFETVIGWTVIKFRRRRERTTADRAASQQPAAPAPHA